MPVYPAVSRPYAYAKNLVALDRRGQKGVSRGDRRNLATLRAIATMNPGLGRRVDEARLSLRVARYIAWGDPSEQERRFARAMRWLRASPEERKLIPADERPNF